MANKLQIKRGLVAGIPTGSAGEPLFTTDTNDLYIGTGSANIRFQKYIASGATTQILLGDGSLYTFPLAISSPSNGQVLKYNGTSWVNDSDAGLTGSGTTNEIAYFTGATTLGSLTTAVYPSLTELRNVKGTTSGIQSQLDAKFTLPSLTSGSVLFSNGTTIAQDNANFFWDDTNNRLGIGTNAPAQALHVVGSRIRIDGEHIDITPTSSATTFLSSSGSGTGSTLNFFIRNRSNGVLSFGTNDTERARFFASGNFGINTGATDSGQRLQVSGDTLITASTSNGSANGLRVNNSGGSSLLNVRNDCSITIGSQSGGITIGNTLNSSAVDGSILYFNSPSTFDNTGKTGRGVTVTSRTTSANTAVNSIIFSIAESGAGYAPTSGSLTRTYFELNATINQTGTATGITRGLYVNPTLTAAADWRSIEWSNNSGWGLYGAGTAPNFFNGSIGIGNNALTGISLAIGKAITGATIYYGINQTGIIQSDVTSEVYYNRSVSRTAAASFTLPAIYHYYAQQSIIGAGSTVTNQYGFVAADSLTGATNNYGFYGNIASGTGRWNLYMNGTANNYMAGSLGIGSTSLTGYTLRVSKNITGSTISYGIRQDGQVQTSVTNVATGILNQFNHATSGTLTSYINFSVSQSTIGTVTNQYGFYVDSSLTGATNNYGFWGDIPSGTNRWNLYMGGTAANYMNGNLLLGSTSDSGEKLQVTGSAKVTGATFIGATLTTTGNADTSPSIVVNNQIGNAGTAQHYIDFKANTTVIGRILRGNGVSGLPGNGINIDSYEGFQVRINQLGGSGGTFNVTGGAATFSSSVTAASFIPSGSSVPTNGMYLPTTNTLSWATNSTEAMRLNLGEMYLDSGSGGGRITFGIASAQNTINSTTSGFAAYSTLRSRASQYLWLIGGSTTAMTLTAAGRLLIGTTTESTFLLDVNGTARVQGQLTVNGIIKFDSSIRDNRDNTFLSQSASSVSANRDVTIGNGTYGRFIFNSKEFHFTQGTAPALGSYGFYFNGETNTGSGSGASIYFKAQTPTATNFNGGDFIIETPSGTGTGRQGRVGIGTTTPTSIVDVAASTTANASLRIRSGVAPTTPNDGDIWFDGTDLKIQIGGVTKTVTVT